MFAEVAFPISNFQTFTYVIPKGLKKGIQLGSRVFAPLGKRNCQGIIIKITSKTSYLGKTKAIYSLVDDVPVVTPELWKLICWMSRYYMTPLGQVAKTVLPKQLSTRYKPPMRWYVQPVPVVEDSLIISIKKKYPKQFKVYNIIWNSNHPIKVSSLKEHASSPIQICRSLEKRKLVTLLKQVSLPDVSGFSFEPLHKKVVFNQDQDGVDKKIMVALKKQKFSPFLLHGVTGSGKTEIYISAVHYCLSKKRTAIILLPEISLTPQIAGRFKSVFGDAIALWHSKLSKSQRSWTWAQICKGKFKVVIGARSAIFAPLKNLGLIVVDEEQEASFRQDSPAPRYHARDVALIRAKYENSVAILSSATPSLESYHNHITKKIKYLHLPRRYGGAKYPIVHIVDMIEYQEESGKHEQVISGLLQDKIEERLINKEQVLLLQNRRGFSPVIRCGDCGSIRNCPHCNVTISYHLKTNNLLCHFCGFTESKEGKKCHECKNSNLLYFGTGTQKVESIMQETFPNASIGRLDVDTSLRGNHMTSILKLFNNGEIDILLGTQMIAKGLDFPNATLVGIINADLGLHLPDFRVGERTFQLIYQASGRAGRRQKQGEVVIQTFSPNNSVIKQAASLNMMKYYKIALKEREELNYPPFSWLSKIEILGPDKGKVSRLSSKIHNEIKWEYKGLEILGPSPCYLEKLRNQFRFHIVFKSIKTLDPNGKKLHQFLNLNFADINKRFKLGQNRININIDPLSLI